MANRLLPFSQKQFENLADEYGTPLFVYDENGIRNQAKSLLSAFSWNNQHKNYFSVKDTPTPGILRVIADAGMGFDCSSLAELALLERNDLSKHGIFYSSNNTPDADYQYADSLGAVINIDKAAYINQLLKVFDSKLPKMVAIRLNPGSLKTGNSILGDPKVSKFGDTPDNVLNAVASMKKLGVKDIVLHTMVASNEIEPEYFEETARILRQFALRIHKEKDVEISLINIGGGLGIDYRFEEKPADIALVGELVRKELQPLSIPVVSEFGRFITGPHGYLVTRVTHGIIESFEPFVTVDTSINNASRMITVKGAYHEFTVLGRENDPTRPMSMVGSMCAQTDKMFIGREFPTTIAPGDIIVIHDAGAHVRSNSHNYNLRPRAGEVLVHPDGSSSLIRRHETVDDMLATVSGL